MAQPRQYAIAVYSTWDSASSAVGPVPLALDWHCN